MCARGFPFTPFFYFLWSKCRVWINFLLLDVGLVCPERYLFGCRENLEERTYL